eukprot:CAMPEP_0203878780 /NCGR_PEP_ID=MMETSP0359-20131031/23304_1 /ASSEMBLY_ACC=CAM_ASM_000338 /TAXON_ID=268821 /ORGANISM="Scrippsiella Hangoei, Strain SHTV-5" /LENGTH=63 /DNA_ID=CAMNT_0050798057 /DNA_START=18 /DNA_END=205 /DNA_ORIENTATION=-
MTVRPTTRAPTLRGAQAHNPHHILESNRHAVEHGQKLVLGVTLCGSVGLLAQHFAIHHHLEDS